MLIIPTNPRLLQNRPRVVIEKPTTVLYLPRTDTLIILINIIIIF